MLLDKFVFTVAALAFALLMLMAANALDTEYENKQNAINLHKYEIGEY